MAETGQVTGAGALTGFGDQPSINESGQVAFVGQVAGFEGVFSGTGDAAPTWVSSSLTNRIFGRAVQINNSNRILARDRMNGAPPPTSIRIWDLAVPGQGTVVAQGNGAAMAFSSVRAQPGFNSAGQPVFSALDANSDTVLVTPNPNLNPPYNMQRIDGALRPQIEDGSASEVSV